MRRAVFGGALLAGALVLSPLGAGAAAAGATPTPESSTPACPAPTESDLSISASQPAAVYAVGGTAYETLTVTAAEDLYPGMSLYLVTAPGGSAETNTTPSISWDADGTGTHASGVFGNWPTWDAGVFPPTLSMGSHTIVIGFSFAPDMAAGTFTASLQWSASTNCDGVSSPGSATFTRSLPSLTYSPPSTAGGSGGGSGTSGGQPTNSAPSAPASAASPSAAASAAATATASANGDPTSAAAAAVPSAGPSASGTEGTVTLTTSAPTSSDSGTVWMLVAVFVVMLAGSVASGSIVKRRRLALEGAPDDTPAETAEPPALPAQSEAAPEGDPGSDPASGSEG